MGISLWSSTPADPKFKSISNQELKTERSIIETTRIRAFRHTGWRNKFSEKNYIHIDLIKLCKNIY